MSENLTPAPDLTNMASNYLTDPNAWYLSPGAQQTAANNLINANWQGIIAGPTVTPSYEDLLRRIEEIEKNSTHINVAKDQENRICELESAVTELMDYIKEQKALAKKALEDEVAKQLLGLNNAFQTSSPQYYPGQPVPTPLPAYATVSSSGYAMAGLQAQGLGALASNAAAHQHAFLLQPDTALDKAKRILGLK